MVAKEHGDVIKLSNNPYVSINRSAAVALRWKHSVRHIRRKSFTRWIGKAIDRRVFRQICDRAAPKVQMRRKEQISVSAVLM